MPLEREDAGRADEQVRHASVAMSDPLAHAAAREAGYVARVLALQRTSGNRAVTRLLQRSDDDRRPRTQGGSKDPRRAESGASVQIPRAVQAPDVPRTPMDPELVRRARLYRVQNTGLTRDSFRLNVAVIKYERDGVVHYAVAANDPAKLHSEHIALREIEAGDKLWTRTRILQVYSERQPCPACATNLDAVRTRIKFDFPVYYSVGKWQPKRTRASELMSRYLGPAAAGGRDPKPPTIPAGTAAKGKGKGRAPEPEEMVVETAPSATRPARATGPPTVAIDAAYAAEIASRVRLRMLFRSLWGPRLRISLKAGMRAAATGVGFGFALLGGWLEAKGYEVWLERQLKGIDDEVGRLIKRRLPVGLSLALRNPSEDIYANIVIRVEEGSTPAYDEVIQMPPTADLVGLWYDDEPAAQGGQVGDDGVLALRRYGQEHRGVWIDWEEYTVSIPLATVLKSIPPAVIEEFNRALSQARAAVHRSDTSWRDTTTFAPREDPVRR